MTPRASRNSRSIHWIRHDINFSGGAEASDAASSLRRPLPRYIGLGLVALGLLSLSPFLTYLSYTLLEI